MLIYFPLWKLDNGILSKSKVNLKHKTHHDAYDYIAMIWGLLSVHEDSLNACVASAVFPFLQSNGINIIQTVGVYIC